ncbi:vascular endothelial growth factor C-like [Daphnia pulex]|uniref:vascular endothelial growth factor C-like n=1 Tax=Daphnia pulex TaxID=6669 RepID=UPI001EE145A6|nr:vascular endothelial growth factor C-like [Daphnia pulex]
MAKIGQKMLSCCLWVAMLLAPLVSSAVVKTIPFKKNVKTFDEWTCSQPQPRVIHIENLDEYAAPNAIYFPPALVIHQCDQSTGCCKVPGQVCRSVESAEEKIQFAVKAVSTSGSVNNPAAANNNNKRNINSKQKKEKKLMISLTNHTRCECVGKIDLRI